MPIVKDQKWPAIFLTSQNSTENGRSLARTPDLTQDGTLIAVWDSLLPGNSGENEFEAYLNTARNTVN